MKLYDLLEVCEDGCEIVVLDENYDVETYFYSGTGGDLWDEAMLRLAKLLDITNIKYTLAVEVNLSEIIENKIDELEKADLFIECDIDSIMDDIDNILAGNVSEKWLDRFVKVLEGEQDEQDKEQADM